jgi:RHS repeat-associated protein
MEPVIQIDLGDRRFARPPHSGNLFDGRLLAEYDIYGACLRDYIYMGSRLVAEYVPATQQYFYYTQDQIGSTRVVTNDTGAVVYAEAHDPYGGIQKTWVNDFDPKRKFSDKERDGETGLDYFGARYYSAPVRWADGHTSGRYRWLSVDPVVTSSKAFSNTQLWNLYSFCRNNPIAFFDPDGRTIDVVGSDPFKKKVKEMMDYLKQSKLGRALLHELEVSSQTISIREGKNGDDRFSISTQGELTIQIDPSTGFSVKTGLISPSIALFHDNPDFAETWAVAYEGKLAASLNEPVRTSHREGYRIPVPSTTCHYVIK